MADDPYRYAIYACPRPDTALAAFGDAWLKGRFADQLDITPDEIAPLLKSPRRYGFHGTLKPPFRLASEKSEQHLLDAARNLADASAPVCIDGWEIESIGGFVALVPSHRTKALRELASKCVMDLDACRAPPTEEELVRRRQSDLTSEQDQLLARWGYPYVLDEFRFHLTLTERVDDGLRARVIRVLSDVAGEATGPHIINDICICIEPTPGAPFEVYRRYPLGTF